MLYITADVNNALIRVSVTIKGGPISPEIKTLPKHKKNSDVGEKKTVYSSSILIEQEDAVSFDAQEEVS
jgi:glutamyl-tRNA synthetase